MTDVLILGGTGWLGGRVATAWLDAGASVTCLARGGRDTPYGARLVRADRTAPGAYDEVRTRDWDEVVDVSSRAAHVAAADLVLVGDINAKDALNVKKTSNTGIALLPWFMVRDALESGSVQLVLPEHPPTDNSYYAVYPGRSHRPAALSALLEFIDQFDLVSYLS